MTQESSQGTRTFDLPGQIPQDAVRVVFQDDNYDPVKDERYDENVLTWHWDNIEVFAEGASELPQPPPIGSAPADASQSDIARSDAAPSEDAPSATEDALESTVDSLVGDGGRTGRVVALGLVGLVLVAAALVVGFLLGRSTRRGAPPPPAPSQDSAV